ncbi:MAG: hypothetical protein FWF85_10375 [Clostridiales bacterium]|nr:hypothetical protein [Clostridiales bacterium]
MKNRQGEDTAMERKQDTEYADLLYKSFKPAYLFSKVLGVMPLSYKIKRTFNYRDAYKRSARTAEFVWSWQSAIYCGFWIVLQIALRCWVFHSWQHLPPEAKANSHHGNLSSGNFSEGGTSHYLPPPPRGAETWLLMNEGLGFACTTLALVTGIWRSRKIPEIFRQLQHLDDSADEDGYVFLGRKGFFPPGFVVFAHLRKSSRYVSLHGILIAYGRRPKFEDEW